MSTDGTVGGRISLTMRTSWLSEFRNASGVLVMFEIVSQRTTFGRLCALLARIPGVEFADFKIPARGVSCSLTCASNSPAFEGLAAGSSARTR